MKQEAISTNTIPKTETFWKKQFSSEVTSRQTVFDVLFGILVPVILLIFDPGVFKLTIFSSIKIFSYAAICLGITVFITWLLLREKAQKVVIFIGIVLYFGGIFASLFGVILSFIGVLGIGYSVSSMFQSPNRENLIILMLGVLGFVPWFTAFVYYRNGKRALDIVIPIKPQISLTSLILAWIFILGIPAFTQISTTRFVSRSVELVLHGNQVEAQKGINNLKKAFWCPTECYLDIIEAYSIASVEGNDERRLFLSKAYKEITGVDLETELKQGQD